MNPRDDVSLLRTSAEYECWILRTATYYVPGCKMTEWGSHYSPFFTADHGCCPVFSGNLFFYDPLSLCHVCSIPFSSHHQSDPCYFRAHPLPPRCFHCPGSTIGCGRVVGGWKPGPVRRLYIYFISSLVYFLYHITYYSVYSVFCILYSVRLPFAGTFYFIFI